MTSSPRPFSQRAAGLEPSATLVMFARVKQLAQEGVEILDLTAGEPDFSPPKCAEEAGIKAIQNGAGRYTPAAGILALRQAVADQLKREQGLEYTAKQILITNGAKIAITQALLVMVEAGDEVLVPTPCWTSYPEMVKLADGVPVIVPCGPDHLPIVAELEKARTGKTSAIMLNSPNNPTGVVYPESILREIGEWAVATGVRIISDEIYCSLTYGDAKHVSPLALVPELMETSVWIGGMSKAYAMTGWRMGFLAGPYDVVDRIGTVASQLTGSPNAISQLASLAALENAGEEREAMRKSFESRCNLVYEALQAMPLVDCPRPEGAFYAFIGVEKILGKTDPESGRAIHSGDDFVELLLEVDRVACIGGKAFGAPNCFRLSFATSEDILRESLRRIAARLNALK
ncbi:MAG: pyridoxal phosphate-dependent aminotransferase [Planctomycetota bacterium]|nr:pyridoxal phosphate-dependent aminotransferase [Planctomycetota bacterium]MDA1113360.1 pyridoxal phosphate-dependent aminotransferase [Planctomycetota bacterium]